eukprot:m.6967 g.6967  ORF g.6967 m.6967 type:complete len:64 (-) comp6398_c0_seq2:77-268(-)
MELEKQEPTTQTASLVEKDPTLPTTDPHRSLTLVFDKNGVELLNEERKREKKLPREFGQKKTS